MRRVKFILSRIMSLLLVPALVWGSMGHLEAEAHRDLPRQSSLFLSQALGTSALEYLSRLLRRTPVMRLSPVGPMMAFSPLDETPYLGEPYRSEPTHLETQRAQLKEIERIYVAIESMDHGLKPPHDINDLGAARGWIETFHNHGLPALQQQISDQNLNLSNLTNLCNRLEKQPQNILQRLRDLIEDVRQNQPNMDIGPTLENDLLRARAYRDRFHKIFSEVIQFRDETTSLYSMVAKALGTTHDDEVRMLMTAKNIADRAVRKMQSRIHIANATFSHEEFSVNDLMRELARQYKGKLRHGRSETSPSGKNYFWFFSNLGTENPNKLLINADLYSVLGALVAPIDNALQHCRTDVRVIFTIEKSALRIDIQDDGPGYLPEMLEKNPTRNRMRAYTYRVTARPDILPAGLGVGKTDEWYSKTDAGARLELDSRPPRPTRETFHFALGPALHLKAPKIPTSPSEMAAQHFDTSGGNSMNILQKLPEIFLPPLLQNMLFIIEDRIKPSKPEMLWGMAAEFFIDPLKRTPMFEKGETLYELLTKRVTFFTFSQIESDRELLEERDPLVLERYWRNLWIVMVLTEISLLDPRIFEPGFSVYDEITKASFREKAPRGAQAVPHEFVTDYQGNDFSALELEKHLFAWSMVYARPMNLPNRLFRYFSKQRGQLRPEFTLALNGVPMNGQRLALEEGDHLEIIPKSKDSTDPPIHGSGFPFSSLAWVTGTTLLFLGGFFTMELFLGTWMDHLRLTSTLIKTVNFMERGA